MRGKFCGWDERAMKAVLENLKGFVSKSGGDEDATAKPQADVDPGRQSDCTHAGKTDQARHRA